MTLFRRGNVWWTNIYKDGVRHQQSTGTSNRRQAEAVEAKLRADLINQSYQLDRLDPRTTFGELAALFVAGNEAKPHHLYHLKFLLPFFEQYPVFQMKKSMAEDFRRMRKLHNPRITEATINRDLCALRHILYWAVDEQLIPTNPMSRIRLVPERRTSRPVLSVAEEQRLLAAASEHLRTMIIVGLDTGMRRGEITSQRWDDIDLARKVLYVTRSKTPGGNAREIPLTRRLYALLVDLPHDDGLMITFRGRQVSVVKTSWKTTQREADVRHMRFHDLRHTFNTRMMEAGVLQEVRMAIMGHSTGRSVHAVYTHIELPTKRAAIEKLERWVQQQQQEISGEAAHEHAG